MTSLVEIEIESETDTIGYKISDIYVIALTFIIFFAIGKIIREIMKNRANSKVIKMPNPRCGSINLELYDENESTLTILSCIADNERYLVKNKKIRKLIFGLVKEKIKNESLVLTPNMIRFFVVKMLNNDPSVIAKIRKIVVSSENRVRLFAQALGSDMIGLVGGLFAMFTYAILLTMLYFGATENCGYKWNDYFEHVPKEGPVRIYAEQSTGQLAIRENDDARQVEIYIPSKLATKEIEIAKNTGERIVQRSYKKSRKKAKEVKFSDFRKTDPVLSKFKDLEEPDVRQESCLLDDTRDTIGIRIDNNL